MKMTDHQNCKVQCTCCHSIVHVAIVVDACFAVFTRLLTILSLLSMLLLLSKPRIY